MVEMNMTTTALSAIPATNIGWLITIVVFFVIIGMLFLISRNIRRFILGGVVTFILSMIGMLARWVGSSYADGDQIPLYIFYAVIGFGLASWIAGWILEKTGLLDKIDKSLETGEEEEK